MTEDAQPTPPPAEVPWHKPRRSRGERLLIVALALGLALFFLDYVLGGAQAAGYLWFQARRFVLDFLAWQIQAYVFVLVPGVLVLAYLMQHVLPIIEIPVLGAGSQEAHLIKVWYRPGSYHFQDGEATWKEGRHQAFINKAFVTRRGLFFGLRVTVPVERIVDDVDGEVLYDPASIPAYTSRTQDRRLQRELRERVVQDHKNRGAQP
jgi:hypothetical protein